MAEKIIVAPLNWGLGHASRCVPIIHFLLANKYTPVLASDGNALTFLRKEFPLLESLELPSYNITYAKNLKWNLFRQIPKVLKAVRKEEKIIHSFITQNKDVVGIISDNRFGVRSKKIPSVYITHQANVLSGFTTFITSKIHKRIIKKFDECWIPDVKNNDYSGKLSKVKGSKFKFIGLLSRFQQENLPTKNEILIVLSGIESQRVSLEKKLIETFTNSSKKIMLIQGKIEEKQQKKVKGNLTIYNYLLSEDLQREINQSELIICRSGYSSIMDLAILGKKAILIPTPGQTEQEYLAKYLEAKKYAPFVLQNEFTIDKLQCIEKYNGLYCKKNMLDKDLLSLF